MRYTFNSNIQESSQGQNSTAAADIAKSTNQAKQIKISKTQI